MPGAPDHLYIRARRALLDAAEALTEHLDSVVLVGAQAVYLHTGDADLSDAAAPYTTDADFAIGPADLADSPLLGDLLSRHGFTMREQPGRWVSPDGIYVDLMVPEALAGPGSRSATVTAEAIGHLTPLFGGIHAAGVRSMPLMWLRAETPHVPEFAIALYIARHATVKASSRSLK